MRKQKTTGTELQRKEKVCAVIPAAGSSSRMGENKLLMELDDLPVLVRTVMAFQQCECIDEIILVCREQDILLYGKLMHVYDMRKVTQIIRGGETRAASVLAGICACDEQTGWVAVHDAARPFVSQETIQTTVAAAKSTGAAAPVVPIKDSVKRVSNGLIQADVPRDSIAAVQTPQVFRKEQLHEALEAVLREGRTVTDDCAAVEVMGIPVSAVAGSYENIKITTPEDIAVGEAILERQEQQ